MSLNFLRRKNTVQKQRNLLYYNFNRGKKPKHILEILSLCEKGTNVSGTLENDNFQSINELRQNTDHRLIDTDTGVEHDYKEKLPEFVQEIDREMLSLPSENESIKVRDKKINDEKATKQNWEKVTSHIEKLLFEISESQNSDKEDLQRLSIIEEILDDKPFSSNQEDLSGSGRETKSLCLERRLNIEGTNNQSPLKFDRENSQNIVSLTKREESHKRTESAKSLMKAIDPRENTSPKSPLDITELQNIATMAKRLRTPSKIKRTSQIDPYKH